MIEALGSWVKGGKKGDPSCLFVLFSNSFMLEFKNSYSMTIVWDFLIRLFPFAPKITFKSI